MPNTKGVTTSPPVIKNLDLTGHGKLVKEIFLLDIQVQIPRRGREQSSHHASILMDIFNVTLLMTAPERMVCCEDGGDCSAYVGPDPRDPLCSFTRNGPKLCA